MTEITNILYVIIHTVIAIITFMLSLRILLELTKVDFFNPISQSTDRFTRPFMKLLGFLPSILGFNLQAFFAASFIQFIGALTLITLSGNRLPDFITIGILSSISTLGIIIFSIKWSLIGSIILSWIAPTADHPAAQLISQICEPFLKKIRLYLPSFSGLDFSPIILILILHIVEIVMKSVSQRFNGEVFLQFFLGIS